MSILAIELETIGGIPLHPLVVHVPVILVPLAFLGSIVALARSRWRSWALPLTAIFAGVSLVGVQLAIQSGEGLEEILDEESALIEQHAQLAEQARPLVFLFFLAAAAAAIVWWLLTRDREEGADASRVATLRKLVIPLCALSVLTGALSTVWIYRTGHTGAESVWDESGDEGGEQGEKSGDDDDGDRQAPEHEDDEDGD